MSRDFRAGLTQQFAAATRMQEQLGFSKESLEMVKERVPQLIEMTVTAPAGVAVFDLCDYRLDQYAFAAAPFSRAAARSGSRSKISANGKRRSRWSGG